MDSPPQRRSRTLSDLTYFVNSLRKRYHHKSDAEIAQAIEHSKQAIAPSKDRTKLNREVHRRLGDKV